jgi:hypothetical protein
MYNQNNGGICQKKAKNKIIMYKNRGCNKINIIFATGITTMKLDQFIANP